MKLSRMTILTTVFFATFGIGACGGGGGSSDGSTTGTDTGGTFTNGGSDLNSQAINSYVNNYILPLYHQLDTDAGGLQSAIATLVANPTDANLTAAQQAWVAVRVPWEQCEGGLFGPVETFGFDPSIDSWPVNRADLDAVLASGQPLNQSTVSNLDPTLKGFHTIEYLLWGADSHKTASQLTAREGDYLTATSADLHSITTELLASWTTGISGQGPYANEVINAGQGSASFPTVSSVLQQFVEAMLGICDEVANGKIADPFDARNPDLVESQFSFNSTTDFANNIHGAEDAYTTSVSVIVKQQNPSLDAKVIAEFDTAIAAIHAIPEPFRGAIQDPANDSTIIAAQQAIGTLNNTLQGEVLPIMTAAQ